MTLTNGPPHQAGRSSSCPLADLPPGNFLLDLGVEARFAADRRLPPSADDAAGAAKRRTPRFCACSSGDTPLAGKASSNPFGGVDGEGIGLA